MNWFMYILIHVEVENNKMLFLIQRIELSLLFWYLENKIA